jgi:hypothetical protein
LTYVVSPLAIGGAGSVYVELATTAQPVLAVRCFVGAASTVDPLDESPALARVDLPLGVNPLVAAFFGAPKAAAQVASFFVQFGPDPSDPVGIPGGWQAGPVVTGINLASSFSGSYPWSPEWVVDRLQDVAAATPPFASKPVKITRSFPRDTHAWPSVSVQVDNMTPLPAFVGGVTGSTGPLPAHRHRRGRLYTQTLSVVAWCGNPEERTVLGRWIGMALEVVLDSARFVGWNDPSFTISESEDFSTLDVPAFLVTAQLTATVTSGLSYPVATSYGHLVAS